MIEFLSLLLGHICGVHPVELSAVGPVAQVEVFLDGRGVGTLAKAPWEIDVDFGSELQPHELVAVARDFSDHELDRARRWINLEPQQLVEAKMVLSSGPDQGPPQAVSLTWESFGRTRPESIELLFDDQQLAVHDSRHVPLPPYDPGEIHFLSAAIRFRGDRVSRLEASFGGALGTEISTELTAIAVVLDKGARMPKTDEMKAWFLKNGRPVPVHGVEQAAPEVVVVRDPMVLSALREQSHGVERRMRPSPMAFILEAQPRLLDRLARRYHLRVMSPLAVPLSPHQVTAEMFTRSPALDAGKNGFLWLAGNHRPQSFEARFPSAVALAGLFAHASKRPRAVLLLLGGSVAADDPFSVSTVRGYLRALQVPLFVWSYAGRPDRGRPDPGRPDPGEEGHRTDWGEVVQLAPTRRGALGRLEQAVLELRDNLDGQRIVWLKGRHLPQQIELGPGASVLRLAAP